LTLVNSSRHQGHGTDQIPFDPFLSNLINSAPLFDIIPVIKTIWCNVSIWKDQNLLADDDRVGMPYPSNTRRRKQSFGIFFPWFVLADKMTSTEKKFLWKPKIQAKNKELKSNMCFEFWEHFFSQTKQNKKLRERKKSEQIIRRNSHTQSAYHQKH